MKRGLLALGFVCAVAGANAVDIAFWGFESVTPPDTSGTSSGNGTTTWAPDTGLGFAMGVHASSSSWSTPAGHLSANSFSSTNWAVGDYYQFRVSTVGLENISIDWDQTGSSTGPRDFSLEYSTNGSSFSNFANYSVLQNGSGGNPTWGPSGGSLNYHYSHNLSSITALNNSASVYFRLTMRTNVSTAGNTVAATGTGRVDNVLIRGDVAQAVPEPFTMTLGLAGAGLFVRRRLRRK